MSSTPSRFLFFVVLLWCPNGCVTDTDAAHLGMAESATMVVHDDLEIDGSAVIGDQLTVHGQTWFANRVDFLSGVQAAGDAVFNHDVFRATPHALMVPGSSASSDTPNTKIISSGGAHVGWRLGTVLGGVQRVTFPLPLVVGDWIQGWELALDKRTSSWCQVHAQLFRMGSTYDESPLGFGASTGWAMNDQLIGEPGLSMPVEPGYQYYLLVTGCGSAGDLIYYVRVSTNRPLA